MKRSRFSKVVLAILIAAGAGVFLVFLSLCGRAHLSESVARGETQRRPFGPGFTFVLQASISPG